MALDVTRNTSREELQFDVCVIFRTLEKIKAFEEEYFNSDISLDEVQKRISSTINEIVSDL